ncbi:MAG: hypothetical protein WBQ44_00060 [Rhodococcus sp. (in: high G+C Gram-positive bacteria)]
MPTSATLRPFSRRAALKLGAGTAITGIALAGAVSCSSDDGEAQTVDTLTTHLGLARRDAAAALASIATAPELADVLRTVQFERTAHADALVAEIDRVAGVVAGASTSAQAPPESAPTTSSAPPPTPTELTTFLSESQRGAADSARNESGYRAGLLGSISAACAVQYMLVSA